MRWLVLAAISGVIGACGSLADRVGEQSGPGLQRGERVQPQPVFPDDPYRVTPVASANPVHDLVESSASDAGSGATPPNDADGGGVSDASAGGAPVTFLKDAYAPLPPAQDGGGFNAIFVEANHWLYLPLFSMPTCDVI